MKPWLLFIIAGLLLTLLFAGGLLFFRHRPRPVSDVQKLAGETWLLYLLLWLAFLSILAYTAFAFGKR